MRLGGAAKAVELRLGGRKDAALAADLGLSVALGDLALGLAARDLGGDFDLRPGRLDAGERLSLDASIDGVQAGPLDLAAAGTLTRERDGDYVPAAGFEAAYWPVVGRTFVVRAGVRRVPEGPARSWTLGGAVRLDGFTLDYAYQPFDGLDAAHRFSVVWR
ncbi:MAG: hypothetical protein D6701_01215 [Gemmatimonadetes bacterium]|nr:MAG: hypothetical protein D6701_01215 [Gemmatimonadota bacterium]